MNISRWFLTLIFLGLSSSAALADGIDPALGVKGDGDASPWTGTLSVLMSPGTTGVSCIENLCNFTSITFDSNVNITNFDYLFSQSQGTPFSVVEGSIFPILTIISDVNTAHPEAILSGGIICAVSAEECPGVTTDFYLVTDGVKQGTTVTYTSNVPEPGTLILMLSGFGAFGLRRLRLKKTPA